MRARWTVAVPLAVLLTACSGEPVSAPDPGPPPMRLVAYDGCAGLLADLRAAAGRRVGPYGLGEHRPRPGVLPDAGGGQERALAAPEAPAAARKAPEHSRTNAHEAGADEPDLVKTDGRRIVALAKGRLHVIDPATRELVHSLDLPGRSGLSGLSGEKRLLLSGDRALVLSRGGTPLDPGFAARGKPVAPHGRTELTLVDLAAEPKVVGSLTTPAGYLDARQTGSIARVVVTSTPRIDFPALPEGPESERAATERNRAIVRSAPLDAWLPSFEIRNGTGPAKAYRTPCEQVSRPASYTGTTMLSVLTLDLARDLGDPAAVSVAADGQTVYGTGSSLYVTSHRLGEPGQSGGSVEPAASTDVHKFATAGPGRPRYAASGSVPGLLLNQYSLSEHGGNLRIATTSPGSAAEPRLREAPPSQRRSSQSAVYVLAQRGARLTRIGDVDGLGKGERIYSVRFIGPTAYVVTFRQVDPLYVIDLRDPRRPRTTGELKINGYSAYLHPTADGRLIGVGQDADGQGRTKGTQISLFDVAGAPKRVGAFRLPGSSAAAEFDPHAFLYWPKTGLTVVPVTRRTGSGGALVLRVDGTGVHHLGAVEPPDGGPAGRILRSLVVGDTLWTLSDGGARASDAATLADRGRLEF
ncbi:beta-propeller domain-containing protein [Spirillospora sp. NPDC029432]|uniref:beta-propeller domain-containing protein n=1 Tax=Spirillospora sp. NPDC029432 TaxID=3154599 RepID=UPI0034546985